MKLTIKAINEIGQKALKQHYEESLKMNRMIKAQQKLIGIRQEVVSQEPLTIVIEIARGKLSSLINPKHISWQVEEDMTTNGAKKDIDYSMEVE